jgi:hypothetical protein
MINVLKSQFGSGFLFVVDMGTITTTAANRGSAFIHIENLVDLAIPIGVPRQGFSQARRFFSCADRPAPSETSPLTIPQTISQNAIFGYDMV